MTRDKIPCFLSQITVITNSSELTLMSLNYLPGCISSPYFFSCDRFEKSWV